MAVVAVLLNNKLYVANVGEPPACPTPVCSVRAYPKLPRVIGPASPRSVVCQSQWKDSSEATWIAPILSFLNYFACIVVLPACIVSTTCVPGACGGI